MSATVNPKITLSSHSDPVYSAAFSPCGTRVVTGSWDNTAKVWDSETGKMIATLSGHSYPVNSASFSPCGTRVVTGSDDNTAKVWDSETGKVIATLRGHFNSVRSAAFSPCGTRVVTGSDDFTAKVWDSETGKVIATLSGHSDSVRSASFSPCGTRVVTGSCDNTAKVWDSETGKVIATLSGHFNSVRSAAFSPCGTRVVTGSWDNTAKVWDSETGKVIATLSGHSDYVRSASFSPCGTRVVTGSADKTAKVWDSETGKVIATLSGHPSAVYSASFSPCGTRVVTGSADKTAMLWDLPGDLLPARQRTAQNERHPQRPAQNKDPTPQQREHRDPASATHNTSSTSSTDTWSPHPAIPPSTAVPAGGRPGPGDMRQGVPQPGSTAVPCSGVPLVPSGAVPASSCPRLSPRSPSSSTTPTATGHVPGSGAPQGHGMAGPGVGMVPVSGIDPPSPSHAASAADLAGVEIPASEVSRGEWLGGGGQGGVCQVTWQGDVHALKVFKIAASLAQLGRGRGRGRGRGGIPSSSAPLASPDAETCASPRDTGALAIPAGAVREVAALKALTSPYVVRLYGVVRFAEEREVGVLMDFCDGGSLRDLIEERVYEAAGSAADGAGLPLPLVDARSAAQLVRDAAYGLKAVHEARIVHSDLKSPNVLLVEDPRRASGWKALIGDFGWARVVQSSRGSLSTRTRGAGRGGTEHWMAPEQLDAQKLTPAADMYSLGCVIWELATGLVPWSDPETGVALEPIQVSRKVVDKGERLEFPAECSSADPVWKELVSIAERCFEAAPERRPTAAEVAARLGSL